MCTVYSTGQLGPGTGRLLGKDELREPLAISMTYCIFLWASARAHFLDELLLLAVYCIYHGLGLMESKNGAEISVCILELLWS